MDDWQVVARTPSAPPPPADANPWEVVARTPAAPLTNGATPGFTPNKAADPNDPNQRFWHSMYDESLGPLIDIAKDAFKRGDFGESTAQDFMTEIAREAGNYAMHPDIRNLPLIGAGATAMSDRVAKQFQAGNYAGAIGSGLGMLLTIGGPAVAHELGLGDALATAADNAATKVSAGAKAVPGAVADAAEAAAGKITAAAGDVAGRAADAATAARAAAPDLGKAAANAAAAYAIHHLGFGTAAEYLGLSSTVPGAVRALGRSGRAALDAWQQARGIRTAGDWWTQFDRAGAESSAEAAAPPVWEPGPAAEPTPQAWEPGAPETYGTPRPAPAWDPHVPGETPPQWDPEVPPDRAGAPAGTPAAAATPFDLAPDARASLPPELVAQIDQLRELSHAAGQPLPETPGLTPEQRLADKIDEHAAFLKMQAQDLEMGNRAAQADAIAGHLIKNGLEPTDANIATADKALAGAPELTPTGKVSRRTYTPVSDETADMIRDRVQWAQGRQAAAGAPAQLPAAAPDLEQVLRDSLAARGVKTGPVELEGNARPAEPPDDAAEPAAIPGTGAGAADQTGGLQPGGTGERAPIPAADTIGDRGQQAPGRTRGAPQGDRTTVRVAGDPKQYVARYGVKELADIQPSHNGLNFEENPKYEHVNDRQYKDPNNQAKIVNGSVEGPTGFEEREVINTAPNASTGPPVLDSRDNVLGGNGRTNIIQRVFASNPAGAARYRQLLVDTAHHFGIDPADFAHMKQPVLVRTLEPAETADAGAAQRAITDFNKIGTASLTPAERAIADARGVSQKTLDDIAQRIEHSGEDGEPGTLATALEGKGGVQVLQKLIDDGVISPQERADLANESQLTRSGRERISNLMLGRFFTNAKQLDNLPLALRAKMERLAAPLARVEGSAEYSLSPDMREALDLIDAADLHGVPNLRDFVNQRGLYAEREFSPAALRLAEQLRTRDPVALTNAARQYGDRAKYAADYQGSGMFGDIPAPLTRGEAFDESFGPEALERERVAKEKAKADKAAKAAAKKAAAVEDE